MSTIPILKLKVGATFTSPVNNTTVQQGEPPNNPTNPSLFITGFQSDELNNITFTIKIYSNPENKYNAYSPIHEQSIFVPESIVSQVANVQTDGSIVYLPTVIRTLLYNYLLQSGLFNDWEAGLFTEPEPVVTNLNNNNLN